MDSLGFWCDRLMPDELSASKFAGEQLRNNESSVLWISKFLNDAQISQALNINTSEIAFLDAATIKRIKAALFEVRFAHGLFIIGLNLEYESKASIGNGTVDFTVLSNPNLLIELTSLRETTETKLATKTWGDYIGVSSTTSPHENALEVIDLLKAQDAIHHKIVNKQGNFIKFPPVSSSSLNMVVVDCRATCISMNDIYDCFNIVYGSKLLLGVDNGVYCREVIFENKRELFKGLFDPEFVEAKPIRERLHAIGFVNEESFDHQNILNGLKIFRNPQFFEKKSDLSELLPSELSYSVVN